MSLLQKLRAWREATLEQSVQINLFSLENFSLPIYINVFVRKKNYLFLIDIKGSRTVPFKRDLSLRNASTTLSCFSKFCKFLKKFSTKLCAVSLFDAAFIL